MKAPTKTRIAELIEFAAEGISDEEFFEYHKWDGAIECDETLTADELKWMRENLEVTVTVSQRT